MSKAHLIIVDTVTLTLSKAPNDNGDNRGFWLWDKTRQMNIAMNAESEQAAFIQALMYYQTRLLEVEAEHESLHTKVNSFIAQFITDDQED